MQTGIIAGLTDRGFGFIKVDGAPEGAKDLFFHSGELTAPLRFDELQQGDKLSFEIEEGDKGPKAVKVSKA